MEQRFRWADRASGAPPREQAVGSQPFGLAIDQQANTVYVTEIFQAGSMSILDAARH